MSQKISYDIPYGEIVQSQKDPNGRVTLVSGNITYPWQQWADRVSKLSRVLQEAALLMDNLDTGTATTAQIATAWNELRVKLQELV